MIEKITISVFQQQNITWILFLTFDRFECCVGLHRVQLRRQMMTILKDLKSETNLEYFNLEL